MSWGSQCGWGGGVNGDGDGIVCGAVGPVDLMLIKVWDVGLNMLQHQSFYTFHDYRCQGNRPVIIQPRNGRGFGQRDYGGGFQVGILACCREWLKMMVS